MLTLAIRASSDRSGTAPRRVGSRGARPARRSVARETGEPAGGHCTGKRREAAIRADSERVDWPGLAVADVEERPCR